jgi:hypothetical protein
MQESGLRPSDFHPNDFFGRRRSRMKNSPKEREGVTSSMEGHKGLTLEDLKASAGTKMLDEEMALSEDGGDEFK